MGGINQALFDFLTWIRGWTGCYGVAIIVFTIIIRLVLTPLDIKSRVSMRKTTKLQPQIQALQKKYANDKEKLNQKTAELYKKEHVNPLSSCLPLLLTWPILIAVFAAMRMVANEELLKQLANILTNKPADLEQFLWIKNLWMPDNLFAYAVPDTRTLSGITDSNLWISWYESFNGNLPTLFQDIQNWLKEMGMEKAIADLKISKELYESIMANGITKECFASGNLQVTVSMIMNRLSSNSTYLSALGTEMQNFSIPLLGVVKDPFNGLLILPIMSAVSQIVMTKITTAGQPQQTNANGQPNTGKIMQWFFPIFSLVICLGYSAAFALYWVSGNLVSMAQTVIINKVLDKKEQQAAAIAGEGNVR